MKYQNNALKIIFDDKSDRQKINSFADVVLKERKLLMMTSPETSSSPPPFFTTFLERMPNTIFLSQNFEIEFEGAKSGKKLKGAKT